ncbi:MAG: hypothetical protein ABIJ34_06265 [archaeon]
MVKKKTSYWQYVLVIIVLGGALYYFSLPKQGDYDEFAACVAASGAKMYGTWWCPHCKDQKDEFGNSWNIMIEQGAYVECSTADKAQTPICRDAGITSYPTWRFPDGSEELGKIDFYLIGTRTGCLESLQKKNN